MCDACIKRTFLSSYKHTPPWAEEKKKDLAERGRHKEELKHSATPRLQAEAERREDQVKTLHVPESSEPVSPG